MSLRLISADECGTTAVEFAIVGPVFLMLIIGIFYTCLLFFEAASMQYAVQQAARCASVNSTSCGTSAAIINYAKAAYYGPDAPVFTYVAASCGSQVSSSADFTYNFVLASVTVPLAATACFP